MLYRRCRFGSDADISSSMIKPLQFSSPSRMEYAAVLYFLRNGVKLHFYSLGTIFEENMKGVQRGAAPWLWVSNRGEKHPCWHTILLAKSSVLYLCFRLTRERGWRRALQQGRVWWQMLFCGSRTGGFCDVSCGTNAGFLRSKIRLSGKGSRGI